MFIEGMERSTQLMVVGLSPSTRYREEVMWILMTCEELIGILFACKQEGELQLGLKKKEVVSIPALTLHHIRPLP